MMFTLNNHFDLPALGVWILLGLCCISVGYVLLILSAQFVYRYFAMSKYVPEQPLYVLAPFFSSKNLKFFCGWRRFYFVLIMVLVAVVYGGCGFVGINLTPARDAEIR